MPQKKVVVIAGPSGSGKNTLINRLMERIPNATKLVSATTRIARADEVPGKDYYFLTVEDFDRQNMEGRIVGARFVPLYGGIHYGIFLPDLEMKLRTSNVIFALVDITGAQWLKEHHNATTIFIMPESLEEFRSRLRARNPDWNDAEYEMRLKITDEELRIHAPHYDYRVVSADGLLPRMVEDVLEILRKEGYSVPA